VFVFSGPAVSEQGYDHPEFLTFFASMCLDWKLEEEHSFPTNAKIHVSGAPET
jgi:hypothetical protein